MRRLLLTSLFALMPMTSFAQAPHAEAEAEAVRTTILDYVEAFYQVAPGRLESSVDHRLAKIGWTRDEQGAFHEHPRSYQQLLEGARRYNKNGWLPVDAPKEITIYEVLDKTASAKLVAQWGIDYLHLAKLEGRWKIINVIWQDHPPKD